MTTALDRTARRIVAGTWGCAVIVMVASAANAALTYGALGDNRLLGLATGVAVDIGLCVALIGDRRLYAHGLSSTWGRVLRITTAAMSLVLNTGISLRDGHYFLALMHAFLPILLVALTEYGQDVLLKLTALAREDAAPSISDPGPSEPGSGGLGRAGSDLTLYAPLDHSGGPAGRAITVQASPDGLDTVAPPSGLGPIDSPARPASPGPGGLPVGRLVDGPLPAPVRSEVPVRPPGAGRPAGPARGRPAGSKRAGAAGRSQAGAAGRSEEQLVQAARELAGRSDGPVTQYALRQAFGLGSARAARLLGQLDPVPVGAPGSNGAARIKEPK